MEEDPRDYRSDTNSGAGWLALYEFYRPLYEGDSCLSESRFETLGRARLNARQLGCCRGIVAVAVVPADDRRRRVCWWDKRVDGYWHDEPFIAAYEHKLDLTTRGESRPSSGLSL